MSLATSDSSVHPNRDCVNEQVFAECELICNIIPVRPPRRFINSTVILLRCNPEIPGVHAGVRLWQRLEAKLAAALALSRPLSLGEPDLETE